MKAKGAAAAAPLSNVRSAGLTSERHPNNDGRRLLSSSCQGTNKIQKERSLSFPHSTTADVCALQNGDQEWATEKSSR